MFADTKRPTSLRSAIILGLVLGIGGAVARHQDAASYSNASQIAEFVGEAIAPVLLFSALWFVFVRRKRSNLPEAQTSDTQPDKPNIRELGMAARFGQVTYWTTTSLSLIVLLLMLVAFVDRGPELGMIAVVVAAFIIFGIGKAARYVLVGY